MERPFEGVKIYYSGSIKGARETEAELPWRLVEFMTRNGADVLSEHVAGRSKQERDEMVARRTGKSVEELKADEEPWWETRRQDLEWLDEADMVVALVNATSHGVGMELQRAIDKPRMGLNLTPILCLVKEEGLDDLSYMIRGVTKDEADIEIKTYSGPKEAEERIAEFVVSRKRTMSN